MKYLLLIPMLFVFIIMISVDNDNTTKKHDCFSTHGNGRREFFDRMENRAILSNRKVQSWSEVVEYSDSIMCTHGFIRQRDFFYYKDGKKYYYDELSNFVK